MKRMGHNMRGTFLTLLLSTLLLFLGGCSGDSTTTTNTDNNTTQTTPSTVPTLDNFIAYIDETATIGTIVGSIHVTNSGDSDISSFTLSDTTNFSIDSAGEITTSSTLDFETTTQYTFTAYATNDAGNSENVSVTININDVVESSVSVPTLSSFTTSIDEDVSIGTTVGSITITDSGNSTITSYTLSDTTNFNISSSGVITTKTTLDYESTTVYNLTVYATNGVGDSASVAVTININDIPDIVPTLTAFTASIDEDVTIGTSVGSVSISVTGDTAITSFTLSDTTNFLIDSSGEITTKTTFDYETTTQYTLTVYATNSAGNSTSVNVTVNISDIADEVPTLADFTAAIDENATIGTIVGSIHVTNSGDSAITSFTLSGTTNFNIDSAGEITTVTTFDYNTTSVYNLTVYATNTAGNSTSVNVTININNPVTPISSICNTTSLKFENFTPATVLNLWAEGQDGILDTNILHWNSITGATSYEYDITLGVDNAYVSGVNAHTASNIYFIYDSGVGGYSYSFSGDDITFYANRLTLGSSVTITMRALNGTSTIATSDPITFTIGKNYITETPEHILSSSGDTLVDLEWCALDTTPSSYTIKYGTSESNLNQSVSGISSATLSQTISSLTNDTGYYFSVAGTNVNGDGKFSEIINTTPTLNPANIDLSIDNVTFNQSVQVDLDNNTNSTPIISNKPGILRVFVNSDSLSENLKVDVKLGGTYGGNALTPIIKEVALSDTPYASADSTNKVIHFDINTTEWMRTGTTFYVELDPFDKISEIDDSNNRYPGIATEESFGFVDRYKMRIKLVPITTNNGAVTITQEIIDGTKEYLESIYPLDEVEVTVGDVLTSSYSPDSAGNYWNNVLSDLVIQKDSEVAIDSTLADVFYFGVIESSATDPYGVAGLAYVNDMLDFSVQEPLLVGIGRIDEITSRKFYEVTAHEIGHNHGRYHVASSAETNDNCGVPADPDLSYPYNGSGVYGRISKTGFIKVDYNLLEKDHYHDLMTYCDRTWISDYNYKAIDDFEKRLDTFYSRSTNPNAYLAPPIINKTSGNMIYGNVTQDTNDVSIYTQERKREIMWNSEISQSEARLYAIVKFINANEMRIPFIVMSLDHIDTKMFKFFIPSTDEIESITIEDTQLSTLTPMQ